MLITYIIAFLMISIPVIFVEKYILYSSSESILATIMFIIGGSIVISMEKHFVETIRIISRNVISRIKNENSSSNK